MQGAIPKRKKAKKEPMGVGESFAILAKNPYIRDLAFLVRACTQPACRCRYRWRAAFNAWPPPNTLRLLPSSLLPSCLTPPPTRPPPSLLTLPPPAPLPALPSSPQVVAYGISINLVEVTWKSKIKAQFPNPNDYSAFMGDFSTATGELRAGGVLAWELGLDVVWLAALLPPLAQLVRRVSS